MVYPAPGDAELSYSHNYPPNSTSHCLIPPEEIAADRKLQLGRSRRGRVFKCFWNDSVVAIRILSSDALLDILLDHVQTWQSLRHPHVLQVFGVSLTNNGPSYIVSQYYSNGDANGFLVKYPSTDRAKIMFECALGMQYLHGRGLVHGSLKPTNILVADNGQVCIADYDMIGIEPSGCVSAHQYFSPEAWKGIISKPSDVFAFAMSCYEIFVSAPPWGVLSDSLIYQLVVRENDRPDRPDRDFERKRGLTDQIWDVIVAAWQKEANLRPTFPQIVKSWGDSNLVPLQSNVPSSSAAGSSIHLSQESNLHGSQRSQDNVLAWQSTLNSTSDSPQDSDAMSITSVPPAYHDSPTKRHTPQLFSWPSNAHDHTSLAAKVASIGNLDGTSMHSGRRLPEIPRNEHSPFPSTSASPDSRASPTPETMSRYSYLSVDSTVTVNNPQIPRLLSIEETVSHTLQNHSYERLQQAASSMGHPVYNKTSSRLHLNGRQLETQRTGLSDNQSIMSNSYRNAAGVKGQINAVLLAGALQAEVLEGRKQDIVDGYLHKVQHLCSQSYKEAQKLVTAGIVPTVILLLKARAADEVGLELVLITLGILACDPITTNIIYRTKTASTLIEILSSSHSDDICALSVWCIHRICRSSEAAIGLIKQDLGILLIQKGLKGSFILSRSSAWCLGILAHTDSLAQVLSSYHLVKASVDHLRHVTEDPSTSSEDKCAAIYVIARMARTIPLSKSLVKADVVLLLVHHLLTSEDPQILQWSARAIGCLMRPNGSDIAKILIGAGSAKALARLPRVLQPETTEPLASFAFAIQRFSCAEWGTGTRKALVEAGVVDSLLAALRSSADVACPSVHIELALAVSSLGDVGGKSIRKEIVKAGGVDILKRVGAAGEAGVARACNLALTTITGNIWTRNTASAKTAMLHNWNGGCPEHQPQCPLVLNPT